jgi:hypothetical protein
MTDDRRQKTDRQIKGTIIKSFCGGSRGAVFSKRAPWPPEVKNDRFKELEMAAAGGLESDQDD